MNLGSPEDADHVTPSCLDGQQFPAVPWRPPQPRDGLFSKAMEIRKMIRPKADSTEPT